jgi:O-methyltransferase involved in polyketide biosynthesis
VNQNSRIHRGPKIAMLRAMAATKLGGVPETMLWTLVDRAIASRRARTHAGETAWRDESAIAITEKLGFAELERRFGTSRGAFAERSRLFDERVKPWLQKNPKATVVELASGLETQFQRLDNGAVRWLCVDLPESIAVRRELLPESERCMYYPQSALDLSWLKQVAPQEPLLVTIQGLLMYLREKEVRALFAGIATQFPKATLVFDVIPKWLSRFTLLGVPTTLRYRTPPMPWGASRRALASLLRDCNPAWAITSQTPWGSADGWLSRGRRLMPTRASTTLLPSVIVAAPE